MTFKLFGRKLLYAATASLLLSHGASAQTGGRGIGNYDDRDPGYGGGNMGDSDTENDWNTGRGGAGGTGSDVYVTGTPTAGAPGMRQPGAEGSMGGGAGGGTGGGSMGGSTGGGRGSTGTGTGGAAGGGM